MVSHHHAKFGNVGSGDIMLLVVAEQHFTCSSLNPPCSLSLKHIAYHARIQILRVQ